MEKKCIGLLRIFCVRVRAGVWTQDMCIRVRTCSLAYPACNAYAPYCVICGLSGSTTFVDILINGMIFGKKLLNTKCVVWVSLQFLFKTFIILRRSHRDIVINMKTSSCKVHVKRHLCFSRVISSLRNCIASYFRKTDCGILLPRKPRISYKHTNIL
jgi:hypothetical protein